ncbi:MAG: DUF6318 family protein, partial [Aeromicrobium sp.]|uniref:DUF6318 family protein n=1 Tax=Aeromicrobium sp. TaxID=1871063 RepID=UPI003C59E9D0
PPTMPAQASEDSPEGAAAFVNYWIALVNFGAVTGNVKQLKATSRGCEPCTKLSGALASQEATERPTKKVWRPSSITPDAVGARATVEVSEGELSQVYDLRFAITETLPYSVRDIQRITP